MNLEKICAKKHLPILLAAAALTAVSGCGDEKNLEKEQSLRQSGLKYLEEGDYENALQAFDAALNERVGIVSNLEEDINFYKAYAQIEAGMTQDAIDTYTALIEYDGSSPDAYYLRGCAYISTGDIDLAADDFAHAAGSKKDSGELYAGIYEQLMSAGRTEEAAEYLEKGLKIKGDGAASCFSRGRLYLACGDYKNAESELRDALDKKEESANLYLGDVLRAQDRNEEARACYEAYAKKHPDDSKMLCALGELALEEASYKQALAYFEQGLAGESLVNKRELWTGKIKALEYMGGFKRAKKEMKSYLKSYPEDEQAQREYMFLKTR